MEDMVFALSYKQDLLAIVGKEYSDMKKFRKQPLHLVR